MKARTLKAAILRKMGRDNSALLCESLDIDPLYMGCLYEQALKLGTEDAINNWKNKMRNEAHNYLELALDYIKAGMYENALEILTSCSDANPLISYYQGYVQTKCRNRTKTSYESNEKQDNFEAAIEAFQKAESLCPDYCFPNRIEEIQILHTAIDTLSEAPMAHYYLGNLLYDKKQYQAAAAHWEKAIVQKPDLAMAYRNLAIFYYNKQHDGNKALSAIRKACELDSLYPRFWLEYDQLAAKLNLPLHERIQVMESHPELTNARDDLYLRYITLLNCVERYEEALSALNSHQFHPWEGGEGKVSAQYRYALIQLAKKALSENRPEDALSLLEATIIYPENLGEGKLPNVPDNEAHYYMGIAYRMMEDEKMSKKYLELATAGSSEPQVILYYNDQPSDYIFYQGLANRELGQEALARKAFHQLTFFGEKHLFDKVAYDFFAVSLPEIEVFQDDIQLRNTQYCNYLRALGSIGLDETDKAKKLFTEILKKQDDYQGALCHIAMIK